MSTSEDVGIFREIKSYSMCRFCAEEIYKDDIIDLNLEIIHGKYMKLLSFLKLDVDLSEDNKLPKHACFECHNKCMDCYNFFLIVENSQKKLDKLYNDNKNSIVMIEPIKIEDSSKSQIKSEMQDDSPVYTNIDPDTNVNTQALDSNTMQQNRMEYTEDMVENNIDKISNSDMNITYLYKEEIDDDNSNFLNDVTTEDKTDCNQVNTPTETDQVKNTIMDKYLEISKEPCTNLTNESASLAIETVEKSQSYNELEANTNRLNVDNLDIDPGAMEKVKIGNKSDNSMNITRTDYSWKDYPWSCEYCKDKFDSMNDLRDHSKSVHDRCYAFSCADCSDDFNTLNTFVEHVRIHREYLRLYCQYCNQKFEGKTECFEHALSHWSGPKKICDLCGEMFEDQESLTIHKKLYKKRKLSRKMQNRKPKIISHTSFFSWVNYEWVCIDCFVVMPDVQSLRIHIREVHNKCFAMKCADCLMVRMDYFGFVRHARLHRPYLHNFCEYCNQYFLDPSEMKSHVDNHYKDEHPCYGCGDIFKTDELLQQHILDFSARTRYKLITEKISFSCEICSKSFPQLHKLNAHKQKHNKKYCVCEYCGKVVNENVYAQHLEAHIVAGKRTKLCEICNQFFMSEESLKRHVKNHLRNDKPFTCDHCGKNFKTKRMVKRHSVSHSDVRPHVCVVCNKRFRSKTALAIHSNQHTGLRPVKCKMCDRTFTNTSNCNKHMIRIHGVPFFKWKNTPIGKLAVDQVTGEVESVSMDDKAEWLSKIIAQKRKKTKNEICL